MVLRSVLITSLVTVVSPWKMRPLPARPDSSLPLPSVSRPLPLPPQPAPTAARCQGPVPGPQGPAAAARLHTEPKVLDGLHPVSCRLPALVCLVGTSVCLPCHFLAADPAKATLCGTFPRVLQARPPPACSTDFLWEHVIHQPPAHKPLRPGQLLRGPPGPRGLSEAAQELLDGQMRESAHEPDIFWSKELSVGGRNAAPHGHWVDFWTRQERWVHGSSGAALLTTALPAGLQHQGQGGAAGGRQVWETASFIPLLIAPNTESLHIKLRSGLHYIYIFKKIPFLSNIFRHGNHPLNTD